VEASGAIDAVNSEIPQSWVRREHGLFNPFSGNIGWTSGYLQPDLESVFPDDRNAADCPVFLLQTTDIRTPLLSV